MKKIFILLLISLGFKGCHTIEGGAPPFTLRVVVNFDGIKELNNIKTIGYISKFDYSPFTITGILYYNTNENKLEKKERRSYVIYLPFENFTNEKGIIDLRLYISKLNNHNSEKEFFINKNLFFTKKIKFKIEQDPPTIPYHYSGSFYVEKVEVDNMEYVKKINSGKENWYKSPLVIKIADADIKKWFEK